MKKISALVLSAAVALCVGAVFAAAEVSLLDEANPMSGWGFGLGMVHSWILSRLQAY